MNLTQRYLSTDSTMQKNYMRCPRYSFYHDGLNWHEAKKSHHLTFGQAFHASIEVLNEKGFAHEHVQEAFDAFCTIYDKDVLPEQDMEMAPKDKAHARLMLELFVKKYAGFQYRTATLDGKPLIEVYGQITYNITTHDGQTHTCTFVYKIDVIKTDGNRVFVFDYKTSGKQMNYLSQMYDLDHQMNNYNLALHSMFPPSVVGGVIVNVLLFRKGNKQGERGLDIIDVQSQVAPDMLPQRAANLISWQRLMLDDAIAADKEFAEGKPLTAFPMRTNACFDWGRTCEYFDLCRYRNDVFGKMDMPSGNLVIEKWEPGGKQQEKEL